MAKIDLFDPKWIDMVFARQEQGIRSLSAAQGNIQAQHARSAHTYCSCALIGGVSRMEDSGRQAPRLSV